MSAVSTGDVAVVADGRRPSDEVAGRIWDAAAEVVDPEIPVLSIAEMGILRGAGVEDGRAVVVLTPTYSGCPAMDMITGHVQRSLAQHGFDGGEVRTVLDPAWTTDWMSEGGKRKLEEFGIAPPVARTERSGPIPVALSVRCPRCGSLDTTQLTRFGSTSCKSLYQCRACAEPFDYFKVL